MVTRKQLHAFQRNEITLILANGSTLKIPAMNVVAALLNVITPEQRRKVLDQCVGHNDAPLVLGQTIDVPATLPKGFTDGVTTF